MKAIRGLLVVLLALAVATAGAPAAPALAQIPQEKLIVPGERLGPIRLGMNITQVIAILGQPKSHSQGARIGTTWYTWGQQDSAGISVGPGFAVLVSEEGTVREAWVHFDRTFLTDHSLHVGSMERDVRAAMGNPLRVVSHPGHEVNGKWAVERAVLLYASGISFDITETTGDFTWPHQVWAIGVWEP